MKFTAALLTLSAAVSFSLRAEDEKKPAAGKSAGSAEAKSDKAESPADKAWAEVESLLKGPKERPKTIEERDSIYKAYIAEVDEKGAAFLKAYPDDARRWKLKLQQVQLNSAREALKISPLSGEEVGKLLGAIVDAKDADAETKATASFMRVMNAEDNADEFSKLAEAHQKAYPDFRGNQRLESQLKKMAARKSLKEKPLELAFTDVNGKEVDLSKMRGKVVLVDFWATWCGPCVAEIPNVVATYKKLHESGFEIVGISFDSDKDKDDDKDDGKEKLLAMTKEKEMPWVQFYDGQGWQNKYGVQYGVNSIPEMWLVDKKGMVVDTSARQNLEEKVQKLLAE